MEGSPAHKEAIDLITEAREKPDYPPKVYIGSGTTTVFSVKERFRDYDRGNQTSPAMSDTQSTKATPSGTAGRGDPVVAPHPSDFLILGLRISPSSDSNLSSGPKIQREKQQWTATITSKFTPIPKSGSSPATEIASSGIPLLHHYLEVYRQTGIGTTPTEAYGHVHGILCPPPQCRVELRNGIHALCERLSIHPWESSELTNRKVPWFIRFGFRDVAPGWVADVLPGRRALWKHTSERSTTSSTGRGPCFP
ncbi:hypothetical protein QBC45DRAFT_457556 [Copromyces sp. CBS 386.78]|nr:hypothetical protein QBC45DRAFT_457556 [Copromyces sp. CBS 386.78]